MGDDGLVEVDAAQALDALRPAKRLEPVGRLAQHRRVEGATTEVVDGNHVVDIDPFSGRILHCRSDWLGHERRILQAGQLDGLAEQVDLELTPACRVRHGDSIWGCPLTRGHVGDDLAQHRSHQTLGGER